MLVKESALLIESGTYRDMDFVILVTAPINIRIKRVVERDKLPVDEVRKRIESQIKEEERLKYADFILENDGKRLILPQINELFKKIRYNVV
jgi:dephospho-CoA kinase